MVPAHARYPRYFPSLRAHVRVLYWSPRRRDLSKMGGRNQSRLWSPNHLLLSSGNLLCNLILLLPGPKLGLVFAVDPPRNNGSFCRSHLLVCATELVSPGRPRSNGLLHNSALSPARSISARSHCRTSRLRLDAPYSPFHRADGRSTARPIIA